MKKVFKMILPLIIIILLATIINAAVIQQNKGYRSSTVFVQNKSSLFSSEVTLGIATWNAISPRGITVNSVSSSTVYDDDFSQFPLNSLDDKTLGHYYQVSTTNDPCCNTSWFHIILNTTYLSSTNTTLTKRVVAHEFGHALNLGHSNDMYDLMYPKGDTCRVNGPSTNEQENVVYHWDQNH